jgi:XTP/dITP diphosphohydrolase
MERKLLIATNNPDKVRELRTLLRGLPYEFVTPAEISLKLDVEETGATMEENARLKATAFASRSGLLSLADDSGLEVDALDGEPGRYSSRFAGVGASDTDRINRLLELMHDVPYEKRTAVFRCILALASPDGQVAYFEGEVPGLITFEPKGKEGFGYDPVFCLPEMNKTMAELTLEEKNRISHRARAVQKMLHLLRDVPLMHL